MSWIAVREPIGPVEEYVMKIKALGSIENGAVVIRPREGVRVDADGTVWNIYRRNPDRKVEL